MPEHPLTQPPAPATRESLSTASAPSNPTFLGEGAAVTLYRGQWIEAPLSDNQLVATGGSVFSEEQTLRVRLDFSSFKEDLATWSAERVDAKIAENREKIADQLTRAGIDLDPELVLRALIVQKKTDALLQVAPNHDPGIERRSIYSKDGPPPALSEFKGISACAERALLAKHLLDQIGVPVTYMGGVAAHLNEHGAIEGETDHSFLVMQHNDRSMIFDVARMCASGWPRLVDMDHDMPLDRFLTTKNLLVSGTCPFSSAKGKMLFGVGNPYLLDEVRVLGMGEPSGEGVSVPDISE